MGEVTVKQVAAMAGVGEHRVRQALRDGILPPYRMVFRGITSDDVAVRAWLRGHDTTPHWAPHVREAAFELLETGRTDRLSDSQRSHLKRRLRTLTPAGIAHRSRTLDGRWGRYRVLGDQAITATTLAGLRPDERTGIGLAATPTGMTFILVDDLDTWETENPVEKDADGDVGVIERAPQRWYVRRLLDTFLLGDELENLAAKIKLQAMIEAL